MAREGCSGNIEGPTRNHQQSSLVLPVQSGSMMPHLSPGGSVRIECAGDDRARAGDIIVFRELDRLVAHRLLFRLGRGRRGLLYQRGDAAGVGHWIRENQVVGIVTVSTDAGGAVLYDRSVSGAGARRRLLVLLLRAIVVHAKAAARTMVRGAGEAQPGSGEYRIRVGAITIGLRASPRRYRGMFPSYFGVPSAPGEPEIRLVVRVTRDMVDEALPDSLYYGKRIINEGFAFAGGLVRGRHLPGGAGVELRVPLQLVTGRAMRVFEHLLHQAFHMASRARGDDSFLIHSAGVVRGGAGYLFVGPSGSGKSTIAVLSRSDRVVNDEICMVGPSDRPPRLHGTPFNGFFRDKVEADAPLRAVLLLSKADAHRLLPVSPGEAVSAIFQQVVPPVALDEPVDKAAYGRMLDAAGRLVERVPVYRLEFREDAGFWSLLDGIEGKGGLA